MAIGDELSPFVYRAIDTAGRAILITVVFDGVSRDIWDVLVHRDAGCAYDRFLSGIGDDGSVHTTGRQWTVPEGDTQVQPNSLHSFGISTIDDLLSYQLTVSDH